MRAFPLMLALALGACASLVAEPTAFAAANGSAAIPIIHVPGAATRPFQTADGLIACSADDGAHGSAIICDRAKGGPELWIAWYGTYRATSKASPARGVRLAAGSTVELRFADRSGYRCSSFHAAMRCWSLKTQHGFLLGQSAARFF